MILIVDRDNLGTTEDAWTACTPLARLAPLRPLHPTRVVVVAPHPDDEILGLGGLLHTLIHRGVPVEIVAVTDGEASHPDLDLTGRLDLGALRTRESREGLRRLGWNAPVIRRAALPDGEVRDHIGSLCELLDEVLGPDDLCLAPWRNDGHPDHDACGQAAALVAQARGADMLQYLVWAWHWADPGSDDLPWGDCRRFDFSRRVAATKRWSSSAFLSQIRPISTDWNELAILPTPILRRFWRTFEVFIEGGTDR